MNTLMKIRTVLQNSISTTADKAAVFFKTGPGQYANGDKFMGVTVPNLRKIAKNYLRLTTEDLQALLESKINEERFLALIILTDQYKNSLGKDKEKLYKFYLKNLKYVNNWNLVDASAHLIVGAYLFDKDRSYLLELAASEVMWERRIAIVSTWHFIRNNDLEWTFKIASLLRNNTHDLIHKAVGWMLREAGKKNQAELMNFLDQHAGEMPRTMLRYSIEKFPEEQRKEYLRKKGA